MYVNIAFSNYRPFSLVVLITVLADPLIVLHPIQIAHSGQHTISIMVQR